MVPTLEIQILGKRWKVQYLPRRRFEKKCGEGNIGLTDAERKTIYLCSKFSNEETIAHELVHAYLAEMCVTSAALSGDQMEEVACDLMAKYRGEIDVLTNTVWSGYLALKARRRPQ